MSRSESEKKLFALRCREIEKQGGDVIAFIAANWPSYTPRGTWFRLQRDYLGRQESQMTDGRPTREQKREVFGDMRKKRTSQADTAAAIKASWEAGESIQKCLIDLGYEDRASALRNVKAWVRKNKPEWAEIFDGIRFGPGGRKPGTANKPAEDEPEESAPEPAKAEPETVFFGGKIYERIEDANKTVYRELKKEGPSPTCCQPAPLSGVTVPDELPEEKPEFLPVCAVKSRIKGEWHLSPVEGCVHLIWEDKITHEERSFGLPADAWEKLANEIPQMLKQLGLKK